MSRVSTIVGVWQKWYQSQGYSELVFLENLDYNRFWLEMEIFSFENGTQQKNLEKENVLVERRKFLPGNALEPD